MKRLPARAGPALWIADWSTEPRITTPSRPPTPVAPTQVGKVPIRFKRVQHRKAVGQLFRSLSKRIRLAVRSVWMALRTVRLRRFRGSQAQAIRLPQLLRRTGPQAFVTSGQIGAVAELSLALLLPLLTRPTPRPSGRNIS